MKAFRCFISQSSGSSPVISKKFFSIRSKNNARIEKRLRNICALRQGTMMDTLRSIWPVSTGISQPSSSFCKKEQTLRYQVRTVFHICILRLKVINRMHSTYERNSASRTLQGKTTLPKLIVKTRMAAHHSTGLYTWALR